VQKAMKGILDLAIIVAAISLIVGIISRIMMKPFPFGLEAQAYLQFSQTMLLFALALGIRQFLRAKDK
jgi:hypothetical protein